MKNYHLTCDELYENYLKEISGVKFTHREIDVIACLMSGKSAQSIANFLSTTKKPIEFQTVNTHISNVKRKIEGGAKNSIIEFVERSDKYKFVHKYYLNLLINKEFTRSLIDISHVLNKDELTFSIVTINNNHSRDDNRLSSRMFKTLALISDKISSSFENEMRLSHLKLEENEHKIIIIESPLDGASIADFSSQALENRVVFINNTEENLRGEERIVINVSEVHNFHFLFFEIFCTLYSSYYPKINEIYSKFKIRFEGIIGSSDSDNPRYNNDDVNELINRDERFRALRLILKSFAKYSKIVYLPIFISLLLYFAAISINNGVGGYIIKIPDTSLYEPDSTENIISISAEKKERTVLNMPPRNSNFVGRWSELQNIESRLDKDKMEVISQAISGLGGVGKTQLTIEYAYRALDKNLYDTILWISAETSASTNNSYREIAKRLDIDIRGIRDNDLRKIVHSHLAKDQNRRILLILDNVPEYKDIQQFLEKISTVHSSNSKLNILITSRSQYWPDSPLIIDNFTKDEAVEFVRKNLPDELEENIIELIDELHYFPLALSQAVAFIKEYTNITDYLNLYKEKSREVLDHIVEEDNLYQKTLWHTWNISLAKLTADAREIIFISSYLNPDDISIDIFGYMSLERKMSAVRNLKKHSFINLINHGQSFKVHRLLQEVVRLSIDQLEIAKSDSKNYESGEWILKAINIFDDKFFKKYESTDEWDFSRKNISHIISLSNFSLNYENDVLVKALALYTRLGIFLTIVERNLVDTIKIWQRIYEKTKSYFESNTIKFFLRMVDTNLCLVSRDTGDFLSAEKYCNRAIKIENDYSIKFPKEILTLLSSIRVVEFSGDLDPSISLKCDQSYIYVRYANYLRALGKDVESNALYNKAFNEIKDYTSFRTVRFFWMDITDNIIKVLIRSHNLDEAEKNFNASQSLVNELIPKNHPYRTYSQHTLAVFLYNSGNFENALEISKNIKNIREALYSPKHKEVAEIDLLIARIYLSIGFIDEAEKHINEAEELYKINYNTNNTINAFLFFDKSRFAEAKGFYDESLKYLEKATDLIYKKYGKNTPIIMSDHYTSVENWEKLPFVPDPEYYRATLTLFKKLFGEQDYRVAKYHFLLARSLQENRKMTESANEYQSAISISENSTLKYPKIREIISKNSTLIKNEYLKKQIIQTGDIK